MLRVPVLLLLVGLGAQGADGKSVTAVFSADSVTSATVRGTVTFTQATPEQDVTIDVDLRGLQYGGADGNLWHVHDYPVTGDSCSQEAVSGHYNPTASCVEIAWEDRDLCRGVTPLDSPAACDSVRCTYTPGSTGGELSTNIGNLDGGAEVGARQTCTGERCSTPRAYQDTHTDDHITLFGENSIVGRSIVIHTNDDSGIARYACATIGQVRVATATFAESSAAASTVRGTVTFSGVQDGPTVVDIDLAGLESGPNPWHIHELAVSDGATTCTETGGHFNPPEAVGQGELSTTIGDLDAPTTSRKDETRTSVAVPCLAKPCSPSAFLMCSAFGMQAKFHFGGTKILESSTSPSSSTELMAHALHVRTSSGTGTTPRRPLKCLRQPGKVAVGHSC